MAPPPPNKKKLYYLIGFSVLHLLVLGAYLAMHHGLIQLFGEGRYVVYTLFLVIELGFGLSFIMMIPLPGEGIALGYFSLIMAITVTSILITYFVNPFSFIVAKYVWIPLTGYVMGFLKYGMCYEILTKHPHLRSETQEPLLGPPANPVNLR
ncbi:hypothetical protein L195_g018180 [Trifolium pratense]|uniref:Uncharacterized protein n=2 Tax=Trifolium pratense TaxID=57577 RepID=A0A2K3MW09_TRIPR|nr:hypothetical protein L195_g018180 [Trifolium pratense]CAJ2665285.1 unnamed protein product [Trifolium pratense]